MKRMSASEEREKKSSASIFPTEDELMVAQILLDLRPKLSFTEYLADFSWKRKRRRSCLDAIPPPIQKPEIEIRDTAVGFRPQPAAAEKGGRIPTSPDSPLLFPLTDKSDEKSNDSSKKKKSKKNYSDTIQKLTQQKGFLRREIANVKKYYSKLMAYNSELKTIQQQVIGGMNAGNGSTHHQPLIADPTVQEIQYTIAESKRVGPFGFDLNVPAEETLGYEVGDGVEPLDAMADKRSRCAEARRVRKEIMKTKSIKNGV